MSIEAELDPGGALLGVMRTTRDTRTTDPVGPRDQAFRRRERRRQDPIALLSRQFDVAAREAVDPGQIAASMEAAGLNDRIARTRYHEESVFRLAEVVFDLVPRERVDLLALDYDVWQRPFWSHVARGLLYVVPTLPYVVAISLAPGTTAGIWLLLAVCVVSTALTQAVAYLAHLLLGYGSRRGAVRVLRVSLVGSVVIGAPVAWAIGTTTSAGMVAAGIAYGVLLYVVSATVLMVFERDSLLMAALVPGVLLSVAFLARPTSLAAEPSVVFALLSGFVVLLIAIALWVLGDEAQAPGPRWASVAAPEWRLAGLHAAYGATVAALMSYAVIDVISFHDSLSATGFVGVGMLPLIVSLGFAEASVYGFRSETSGALASSFAHSDFAPQARVILVRRRRAYTATLVVLTLAVLVPLALWGRLEPLTVLRHVGYAELGVTLLGAMMLVSCGLVARASALLAVGLVVDAVARLVGWATPIELTIAHVVVFAGLVVLVWSAALDLLTSPRRHR